MKFREKEIEALLIIYYSSFNEIRNKDFLYSSNISLNTFKLLESINLFLEDILFDLSNDEREFLELYFKEKKTIDYISITIGYANHSSISRMKRKILKKILNKIDNRKEVMR